MSNHLFHKICAALFRLTTNLFIASISLSFILLPIQAHAQGYNQNKSVNAGFYLHMPFGKTEKNDDRLKYGLRLNMTQEINARPQWRDGFPLNRRQNINMDLMSLNFSESGFRDMSFAGQKTFIYQNGVLRAAANAGEGGRSTGKTIFIIGAVAGLGLIGYAIIETSSNDTDAR